MSGYSGTFGNHFIEMGQQKVKICKYSNYAENKVARSDSTVKVQRTILGIVSVVCTTHERHERHERRSLLFVWWNRTTSAILFFMQMRKKKNTYFQHV